MRIGHALLGWQQRQQCSERVDGEPLLRRQLQHFAVQLEVVTHARTAVDRPIGRTDDLHPEVVEFEAAVGGWRGRFVHGGCHSTQHYYVRHVRRYFSRRDSLVVAQAGSVGQRSALKYSANPYPRSTLDLSATSIRTTACNTSGMMLKSRRACGASRRPHDLRIALRSTVTSALSESTESRHVTFQLVAM